MEVNVITIAIKSFLRQQLEESAAVKQALLNDADVLRSLTQVTQVCIAAYQNGNKTLIAGNGGSAADAQHIAAEFVSRFYFDRPGLPSIALTTDTSILTAIGNDYGYANLFKRQLQANSKPGDVFIGISTSGTSANIIEAIKSCNDLGVISVGLTGADGGEMKALCDHCLQVPTNSTPRIQEAHILFGHALCAAVEATLFKPKKTVSY